RLPRKEDALMAATKTSLHGTRCERSQHLCVAPTFVKEGRALWSIVDLTDLTLVGVRWTNVGESAPVTERSLEDEKIAIEFCEKDSALEQGDWKMQYHLTSSDGLEIFDVQFRGVPVLKSAKLVDWHVSYSKTEQFGYSDAIGCPIFSQAAVIARAAPKVTPLYNTSGTKVGFSLIQEYFNQDWPSPCNYNYRQEYEFYTDGRFRVKGASVGRGCGNDGVYRPVFRLALPDAVTVSEWKDSKWQEVENEQWRHLNETTVLFENRFQYRLNNSPHQSYLVEPSTGQFSDGGRGDSPYTYITKYKSEEGEANLITLGSCCNTDYQQGPEVFMTPEAEPLKGSPLVLWYVGELQNDEREGKKYCWAETYIENGIKRVRTFPCFAGPMFVPEAPPIGSLPGER
ncbi:MAG: hypothetical protein KDD60_05840, partial [Bdellovibrionales bacterium]|nr:hypothetical protein [Bdellovibrionales bacterium]